MLKMFHRLDVAGSSVEFWEQTWTEGDFAASARFCDVDPLRSFFDRNVRPGSVMLEGGCGRGLYVAHHAAQGVRAVGLDFATRTLLDVRDRYPGLLLGAADVARLPLRSRVVDTYYSGGVVEHFEAGPDSAIAEANRVLRPDGVLLISVPYFSPLRRALAPFRTQDWARTGHHNVEPAPAGRAFFQYAYTPKEFKEVLTRHGFSVRSTRGYSILWGLYEMPLLGRALGRVAGRRGQSIQMAAQPSEPDTEDSGGIASPASTLRRLLVSEDDSVPVLGLGVRFLRWFAANMMMYECVVTRPRRT